MQGPHIRPPSPAVLRDLAATSKDPLPALAASNREVATLWRLYQQGMTTGVPGLRWLADEAAVQEIEPHCRAAAALHCPSTGIVDYAQVSVLNYIFNFDFDICYIYYYLFISSDLVCGLR